MIFYVHDDQQHSKLRQMKANLLRFIVLIADRRVGSQDCCTGPISAEGVQRMMGLADDAEEVLALRAHEAKHLPVN
jgi:hypothetical protein